MKNKRLTLALLNHLKEVCKSKEPHKGQFIAGQMCVLVEYGGYVFAIAMDTTIVAYWAYKPGMRCPVQDMHILSAN